MDFASFAGFDTVVATALRSVASPLLTRAFWVATLMGDATVMTTFTALAVVLLLTWGRRRDATVLAVLMIADPLIASVLKNAFARPRPPVVGMLIGIPSDASFPSGHALASLLCYGMLAVFALREGGSVPAKALAVAAALSGALFVGLSRIYLGVHWPSDVVASWLVASVLVAAGWGALALWEHRRGPEAPPDTTVARRRVLAGLAVSCAVVLVLVVARQAGIDPLL